MKNEKLIWEALRMLYERAHYWVKKGDFERGGAYQSAHYILLYALEGNEECLRQFDTYGKEEL